MRQTFRRWILRGATVVCPLILLGSVPAVTTGCESDPCLKSGSLTSAECDRVTCCDSTRVCKTIHPFETDPETTAQVCVPGDAVNVRHSSTGITAP
jgi:hypothetical protein